MSYDRFHLLIRYFQEGPKYHLITVIHSIYYVNQLEEALTLLRGMLEPGGALIVTIVTGKFTWFSISSVDRRLTVLGSMIVRPVLGTIVRPFQGFTVTLK